MTGKILRIMFVVLTSAGAAAFAACEDTGGPCVRGEACVCTKDCNETCDGGDCSFECADGASCTFSCPGGRCSVDCDGAASCTLDCPGDACTMECTDTARCELRACDEGCPLSCGGAETCSNSCTIDAGCPTA